MSASLPPATGYQPFPYARMGLLLLIDVAVMCAYKYAETHLSAHDAWFYWHLLQQPFLWIGLGLSALQLKTWTSILSRSNLSIAYPIASLNYPMTMLAAHWLFGEHLSSNVWLGGGLITMGVMIFGLRKTKHVGITEPELNIN